MGSRAWDERYAAKGLFWDGEPYRRVAREVAQITPRPPR